MMREMTERLRTDAELAAAYRAAHETLPGPPRADRARRRDRRHQRRRHAEPGQVPARAGRARAGRRAGRQPARRRGAGRAAASGGPHGPCVPARRRRMTGSPAIDCGTNSIRLLVADVVDGAAHRRGPRDAHRAARAGRRPDRAARARGARAHPRRAGRLRRARSRRTAPSGCGWSRPAPPATPPTATSSSAMVRAELGVEPEVITGREEAALSFAGAASVLGQVDRAAAGRRHRRRLDRARPRRRRRPRCERTAWTSAACG